MSPETLTASAGVQAQEAEEKEKGHAGTSGEAEPV